MTLMAVEVDMGSRIWGGTRPIESTHKHLGYLMYTSQEKIIIAPELTVSFEGRSLRIEHEKTLMMLSTPSPRVRPLSVSSEETTIIEIKYEDPFHLDRVLSEQEARDFRPSTLRILGYLVQQNERYVWVAMAQFEYADGTHDYETVHVIPKPSIRDIVYMQ